MQNEKPKKRGYCQTIKRKPGRFSQNWDLRPYFDRECLSAIVNCLEEITSTPNEIVKLRGTRFADCKQQAEVLVAEQGAKGQKRRQWSHRLLFVCGQKLVDDYFCQGSTIKHVNSARVCCSAHLHQFRQSEELSTKWTELCRTGLNPVDRLLLQKLVSLIFADISRHRSEAVASALQLRKTYVGETSNKPSLDHLQ